MSLKNKLSLSVGVLLLVVMVLFSIYLISSMNGLVATKESAMNTLLTEAINSTLQETIIAMDMGLKFVANNPIKDRLLVSM